MTFKLMMSPAVHVQKNTTIKYTYMDDQDEKGSNLAETYTCFKTFNE